MRMRITWSWNLDLDLVPPPDSLVWRAKALHPREDKVQARKFTPEGSRQIDTGLRRLPPAPPSNRRLRFARLGSRVPSSPLEGPYIPMMNTEPSSIDALRREVKSRIRLAVAEGEALRREFLDLLAGKLNRKLWTFPLRESHDSMRFLNLRVLMLRYHLSMDQIVEVMLVIHRGRLLRGLPSPGHWFSPESLLKFEDEAGRMFPEAANREKADAQLLQIAASIDESPLPASPLLMTRAYRDRLKDLDRKSSRISSRFRRPFRGNPWRQA